jgi:hypothetical protein
MTNGKLSKLLDEMKYPVEEARDYIGASSIGSDCLRQIWYEFKGYKGANVPNKLKRTWEIGRRLELMIIDLLKQGGILFEDYQFQLSSVAYPYFKGHFDGLIIKPRAILEIKTAKDASFKIFIKQGCKRWNTKYYSQLQSYMGLSGVHSSYIIVLNKDNSEVFDELVLFDERYYSMLLGKAEFIYNCTEPPPRVNNSPMWFQCKMCKFKSICHK